MVILFWVCLGAFLATVLLHFKSVEHEHLKSKLGSEAGVKRGKLYGIISGTLEFILLVAFWIVPQPHFRIPWPPMGDIETSWLKFPYFHIILAVPFVILACFFGIKGLFDVGTEVADTHMSPEKVVDEGLYAWLRHPQYFGWILAHIGFTLLFSALYSLILTPFLVGLVYLLCWKEEKELLREFGDDYREYQQRVPMLFPWKKGEKN